MTSEMKCGWVCQRQAVDNASTGPEKREGLRVKSPHPLYSVFAFDGQNSSGV